MISKTSLRPVAASLLMAAAIIACLVEPAFAQAAGVETVLQNIVDMLTGNIARLLAVIAVIIICIAWMFGYMDLRRAGFWIIGIGGIFGATELVNTIVGS
ncbi:Type IV secretory pathway AvhB2 protein [Rhizobium ruizarguesonis]|jgi:type IV secretion system protein VirB2|uniref:Type IV secretory pathway AvhB2 protein n=1 Tax=Rhizobium ruizarguesonis TaxID=2081791 RepID=A0ABY1X481_9HYPH|nr:MULTISPECIES: TrbC/VirB2 family protein [Rhizobium]NKK59426.1 Type IV secretory pathway AvhB2 protein [Rhizobium leguminosarum bv. viciae]MBY5751449.1 Type IV secretory pathway AvhB2 protein [Rhizobium leguminosarum]NEI06933.1 Type IV secretory pathway AvhB2 protein [Rhizobium ruizarguesonis]TAT87141.1 Type IV secretory pathway AvhB2 protein [Rhizobium ruizarguesonis]TAU03854.1 Type IV secretory pathway AvhB2 protein [Rhizobium ruizarguesonis]